MAKRKTKKKAVPYIHGGVYHSGEEEAEPKESAEYISQSSIDRPPREEKEPEPAATEAPAATAFDAEGQAVIPGTETTPEPKEEEDPLPEYPRMSRSVKFKLTLKLDNCVLYPAEGEAPADMIEETVGKGLRSKLFLRMLRSSCGRPMNAGLLAGDAAAQLLTLESIGEAYRRALEAIMAQLPARPEFYSPADLEERFKRMRTLAERAAREARALRTGTEPIFAAPADTRTPEEKAEAQTPAAESEPEAETPTLPQEPRSDDGEGNGLDDGETF